MEKAKKVERIEVDTLDIAQKVLGWVRGNHHRFPQPVQDEWHRLERRLGIEASPLTWLYPFQSSPGLRNALEEARYLKSRLAMRNRQIRDLRRQLRK